MSRAPTDGPPGTDPGAPRVGSILAGFLGFGAVAAVARGLGASALGRTGAVFAAAALVVVALGAVRGRGWALGSAFFLGLFWIWAVVALGLQDRLVPVEAAGWIAWSGAVMVLSVRARRDA